MESPDTAASEPTDDANAAGESPAGSAAVGKGALFGFGGGGLVVGVVCAILVVGETTPRAANAPEATPTTAPGSNAAEAAPAPDPEAATADAEIRAAQLAAAVDVIAIGRAKLHKAGDGDALKSALARAIHDEFRDDNARKAVAQELYERVGVGRMVRAGKLTPLGGALAAFLEDVDLHGFAPADYQLHALKQTLQDLARPGQDAAEPQKSRLEVVVGGLLTASDFDRQQAEERLRSVEGGVDFDGVGATVDALLKQGASAAATPADAEGDVALMSRLIQLVMDFKQVKRAGPFELRSVKSALTKARPRARLLDLAAGLIDAAEDGGAASAAIESLYPPHPQYRAMLQQHDRYRELAVKGCATMPTGWKFRPGADVPEVKQLQQRLKCEGYYDGPIDGVYDGDSLAAAKRYQRHHELEAKGFVFQETLTSMNVPIRRRAEQIRLALQRMRESKVGELGDFYIRINLPAFELSVYDKGELIDRKRVIVGTNRLDDDKQKLKQGHINRTKLFTTRLYEVIVNPSWILPPRVEHGELKGHLAKDPDYLEKNNIKQVQLKSGKMVYIQGKGEGNVLGRVKFLLEKSNAIYLHDTDKRSLFAKKRRDFSHGCVRLDDAENFGKWVLRRDGWDHEEIRRAFRAKHAQRGFKLKEPISLVTEYITVDLSDEGLPVFLTDIYKYDDAFERKKLPPVESQRWGHPSLRPHWVPAVSESTVAKWRAKGMSAPRNYDPAVHGP